MNSRLFESQRFYYFLFVVILVPALLLNLDVHHIFIHNDESLRALIALEMNLSEQYIAPTVNGEFYYNKPPLYNWIIAASFKLFGQPSLLALRIPVVAAIFLYGGLIVYFIGKAADYRIGWLTAIATITSGRILFYDSFLGLIDLAFSLIIFTNFMLFYHFGKREKFYWLFASTYFLSAIAYLMKGLPPIVFQGLTLIAFAVYRKDWRIIFHKANFIGILFFILPVGIYYYAYLQVNPQSLLGLFETLWEESSKRTVTDHGILDTLKSLYEFPLENLYHFAPWTLLIVVLFRKGAVKELWQIPFARFTILVFAFNIIVYWTAPGVHPRYLFMFLPLLFYLLFEASRGAQPRLIKVLQMILLVVMSILSLAPIFTFEMIAETGVTDPYLKAGFTSLTLLIATTAYARIRSQRWIILGIFLLFVRIGFNWFVLPNRDAEGHDLAQQAVRVAQITAGEELFILRTNWVASGTSFMIERERREVLEVRDLAEPGKYYIIERMEAPQEGFKEIMSFRTRASDKELLLLKKNQNVKLP